MAMNMDTGYDYFGRVPAAELYTDAVNVPGVPNTHPMAWRVGGDNVPANVAFIALLAVLIIASVQFMGFRSSITIGG
jgi:hypothetical protein